MAATIVLLMLVGMACAIPAPAPEAAQNATFFIRGGAHLFPSYFYQLEVDGTAVMEMRESGWVASAQEVQDMIAKVRKFAADENAWIVEYSSYELTDPQTGQLIGYLNCGINTACPDVQKIVREVAASAEVSMDLDKNVNDPEPTFYIEKSEFPPQWYTVSFTVYHDTLLFSAPTLQNITAARENLAAFQAYDPNTYTWESVRVGNRPPFFFVYQLKDSTGTPIGAANMGFHATNEETKSFYEQYYKNAAVVERDPTK
eukprot:CAMPEP_0177668548 /NCGR_PEP_ID=MMETSP0447-20121125/22844_1 /TAXON_ID=0 /ORGANISM="Stygamoeba regulata, Strain BSH-02190019" /LENGTH=257 /DNA_ID=CAMNT_0019175111 /DNA_START=92 /DNA_END=865 /DNA_ORIENTATION=+